MAEWWRAEWSSDKSKVGFEKQKKSILAKLNADRAPFILVAQINGKFIASAALFLHDLDSRPDLSPWLSGVFTVPEYRGRGIAKTLMKKVLDTARKLGYDKVYLHTEHIAELYQKLGWQKLCNTTTDQGETSEIYRLIINDRA